MIEAPFHRHDTFIIQTTINNLPYILAYESLSRISRPPKNRVRMWSKITDPHGLVPEASFANSIEAYSVVAVGDDVKATCLAAGVGRPWRPHDH